jgi:ABC-type Mn2+/Zn2+ transport system permease subunit
LFVCFGIGQGLQFQNLTWAHWIYLWGIVAFGIGAGIIAGIFPEDTRGVEETVSGKIHGIFSGLGFIFLILNPLWALCIDELNGLEGLNTILFVFWNIGYERPVAAVEYVSNL